MQAVEERVCDRAVLKLLRAILRAGVLIDGQVRRAVTGTAQGGVISPLMANVYLHRLDRVWRTRGCGVSSGWTLTTVPTTRTEGPRFGGGKSTSRRGS